MVTNTKIFLTGATGYIGGSVLQRLLTHPEARSFDITALVRNGEKAKLLESFSVKTIIGSISDFEKVEAAAASSDVVFSIADCDDLPAVQAILNGLKKRHAETGTTPILIHTSGTGVLIDNAEGKYATEDYYSDLDIAKIETLGPQQPHRWVDTAIVAAGEEGYVRTHIILPSSIFGLASGPLFERGISNTHSMHIPMMIRISWNRRGSGIVGPGKNIWPLVHIDEITDLYIVLFDKARKDPSTPNGRQGFYFGENGHFTQYEVAKAIGESLVEKGRTESSEPTTFSAEELDKYFAGIPFLGTNSACKAERSRAIGWKPTKTTKDALESVPAEVDALIGNGQINDAFKLREVLERYSG
ncbi:NAD(P)-binding protein [Neolentinus lepideus HHB14362 ss-1]|uniref:NAD(P)-binding protein n=1 Tax=Neolentinus lepideus HHB14362 ss-1 TaxID=1314782 RepID=A0A165R4T2_9AGAM|nr:NAD(P)-binding protein [Neolentinus lepideus HHB14362 ss-1]